MELGRYDYDGRKHRLIIRTLTGVHELFINSVEDAIRSQLKIIRSGLGRAALFARKVRPARLTEIYFLLNDVPPNTKSKYKPDVLFWHDNTQYPRVIIEVVYS